MEQKEIVSAMIPYKEKVINLNGRNVLWDFFLFFIKSSKETSRVLYEKEN